MELMLGSFYPHPALLIASGIDSLTSREVCFLNNFRRYFRISKMDMTEVLTITPIDFQVGGLLNPRNEMIPPEEHFHYCCSLMTCSPYMSREEIYHNFYKSGLDQILSGIKEEIIRDMMNVFDGRASFQGLNLSQRIALLYKTDIHPKIVALHLCGIGSKLGDAFRYLLEAYDEARLPHD